MKTASLLLLTVVLLLSLSSCSRKVTSYPAEVTYVTSTDEVIVLRSFGYSWHKVDAIQLAEKNAVTELLFRGIPGSQQSRPMIENESEARQKNAEFFTNFFDKGGYKQFVMSSTPISNMQRVKHNRRISEEIKINTLSLRRNLEQNSVIRKFGL